MSIVKVNQDKCIGCGACVAIDPENFDFNDDGISTVINEIAGEKAKEAEEACPVYAIDIIEDEGKNKTKKNKHKCHCEECSEIQKTDVCECNECDCDECDCDECDCDECDCDECGCDECDCDECGCEASDKDKKEEKGE